MNSGGINFWVAQIDSGLIPTEGLMVNSIIKGAYAYIESHPEELVSTTVKDFLLNKIEVGTVFAQEAFSGKLSNDAAVIAGYNVLNEVTNEAASVDEAIFEISRGTYSVTELDITGSSMAATQDVLLL